MKADELKDQIARDTPFANTIRIQDIYPFSEEGSLSRGSFLITDTDNTRYKLRACPTTREAKQIERNVRHLSTIFPRFFGRDRNYLLFDWIEGDRPLSSYLTGHSREVFYQIGKIAGQAHELNDIDSKRSAEDFFNDFIDTLTREPRIDKELLSDIQQRYSELREHVQVDIVLEVNDLQPKNFIVQKRAHDATERVYFVDEDGLGHTMKGLGFAKPLFTETFFKYQRQRDAFWNGYRQHHSTDYFDRRYQEFVTLVQIVRSLAARSRSGRDLSKPLRVFNRVFGERRSWLRRLRDLLSRP